MLFLLILYIGNKASLTIRHKIHKSLEIRYCGVPLYIIRIKYHFNILHSFEDHLIGTVHVFVTVPDSSRQNQFRFDQNLGRS